MKTKKYLEFYKRCMKSGLMPDNKMDHNCAGLCGNFGNTTMKYFMPTHEDCQEYGVNYWGYYGQDDSYDASRGFGPTRQNIVLFLAAMNDEL